MPRVTGPLTTTASSDNYPTHDSLYGLGGLREVADHAARNAIPNNRRREGMQVYTANDTSYWMLKPSPWTGVDADWIAVSSLVFEDGLILSDENGDRWVVTAISNGSLQTTPYGSEAELDGPLLTEDSLGYLLTEDSLYYLAQETT